jgi:hypothetical protein
MSDAPSRSSLDGEPPASARNRTWLPVARMPSPARTCWTRDRGSSRTAPPLSLSPGVFGRGQGCDPASGALCRDGVDDAVSHEDERPSPGPSRPPSRQRRRLHRTRGPSIGGVSSSPSRSRGPLARDLLPRGFRGAALRLLQSNAIREHDLEPTEPRCTKQRVGSIPYGTGLLRDLSLAGRASRVSSNQGPSAAFASLDAVRALGRASRTKHGRTGRPRFASTRAPFVANPWGTSWRGLQPGAPVSDALLRTCRSSGARPALAGTTRSPHELAFAKPVPPD